MLTIEEYCENLRSDLLGISDDIENCCCTLLQDVLGTSWISQINAEINSFQKKYRDAKPVPSFHSHKSELFLDLRTNRIDLLELDNLVDAIDSITKKKRSIHNKLKKICNENPSAVRETLFEIISCGTFAIDSKLKDIDFKIVQDSGSNVDAKIKIEDRDIFVEATLISKRLGGYSTMSIDKMMKQVENKILEKTTMGKQLALAEGPTLLIIGLPSLGADFKTSQWQLNLSLPTEECKKGSAVIISGSYTFKKAYIRYNSNSYYPFTRAERAYLNNKFKLLT